MIPKRRCPSGLITAPSCGPYRLARRIDYSCELESERIDWAPGGFQDQLLVDMRDQSIQYLAKHYPELTFARIKSTTKPKGYDFWSQSSQNWTMARWRTV